MREQNPLLGAWSYDHWQGPSFHSAISNAAAHAAHKHVLEPLRELAKSPRYPHKALHPGSRLRDQILPAAAKVASAVSSVGHLLPPPVKAFASSVSSAQRMNDFAKKRGFGKPATSTLVDPTGKHSITAPNALYVHHVRPTTHPNKYRHGRHFYNVYDAGYSEPKKKSDSTFFTFMNKSIEKLEDEVPDLKDVVGDKMSKKAAKKRRGKRSGIPLLK